MSEALPGVVSELIEILSSSGPWVVQETSGERVAWESTTRDVLVWVEPDDEYPDLSMYTVEVGPPPR